MPRNTSNVPRLPTPSAEWDALLASYPADVRSIALAARELVLSEIAGVMELVDTKAKVIGYGFGTGYADLICSIILSKAGVKLGLVGGATLPDPQGLLEGSGKVHRYVVLTSADGVALPAVRALLTSAVAARTRSRGKS